VAKAYRLLHAVPMTAATKDKMIFCNHVPDPGRWSGEAGGTAGLVAGGIRPRGAGHLLIVGTAERACGCTPVVHVDDRGRGQAYQPLSLVRLGALLAGTDESLRWRLVAEFLEEYRWEPLETRWGLLAVEPLGTGDERWDVFLAALAEHLAARDGRGASSWVESRSLRRLWFPFNTRAARVDALVHAPAAFRRRGVYVVAQELGVA
jgi:hypothetical protein